ncbi:MAG: DUF1501 domain-containing protein [Bryobacterales bacterium]|nr:DUF1501 domain-containing protein [Bryobacterales bacterium]
MSDVHATIPHLMGLNDLRLMHYHAGRYLRLTDTGGEIIRDAVAERRPHAYRAIPLNLRFAVANGPRPIPSTSSVSVW